MQVMSLELGEPATAGNVSDENAESTSATARPVLMETKANPSLAFIVYDSSDAPQQSRKDVRAFAARKCAAKRRATMQRKAAERLAEGIPKKKQARRQKSAGSSRPELPPPATPEEVQPGAPPSDTTALARAETDHLLLDVVPVTDDDLQQTAPPPNISTEASYPTPATTPDAGQKSSQFLEVLAASLSSGGQATLPASVWQTFIQCGPLFHTLLLLAATHRQHIPPAIQLWLRQDAMRSIIAYVHRMSLMDRYAVDKALAAIALLAYWEHCFGDKDAREMHKQGLRDILDRQRMAGLSLAQASAVRDRLAMLTDAVTQNGAALALQAFKDYFSIFSNTLDTVSAPLTALSPCPPGFAVLRSKCLFESRLLRALVQVSYWNASLPDAGMRLRKLIIQLTSSHASSFSSSARYEQAHLLARLAGLELSVGVLFESNAANLDVDFVLDTQSGSHASAVESAGLRPELLIETQYMELTLWATSVICAVTGAFHSHHVMALCAFLHKLNVRRWADFEETLARFAYPKDLMEERCRRVWETVCQHDNTLDTATG